MLIPESTIIVTSLVASYNHNVSCFTSLISKGALLLPIRFVIAALFMPLQRISCTVSRERELNGRDSFPMKAMSHEVISAVVFTSGKIRLYGWISFIKEVFMASERGFGAVN